MAMAIIELGSGDGLADALEGLGRKGKQVVEVSMHWSEPGAPCGVLLQPGSQACVFWAKLSLEVRVKLAKVAAGAAVADRELARLYAEYRQCLAHDQAEPENMLRALEKTPPAAIVVEFD